MNSFAGRLRFWAAHRPDKLAAVAGERRLTYRELDRQVDEVGAALRNSGVSAGEVVSSQLPNGLEALVVCLATNRLGAVHNPIVTTYREREVDFIRRQAHGAVFVGDVDHELFSVDDAGPSQSLVGGEGPSFLLYTSGSTAEPKGVLHSDRTLGAECAAQARYHGLGPDEVFVTPSPMAHISGLLHGALLPVWLGATTVLMDRWEPGRYLDLVQVERGTYCAGAPVFLAGALDHADTEGRDLSSLRVFPVGGADVPPQLVRRALQLGVRSGRGYGSTEFPSITSGAGPSVPEVKRAETDGRPIGANRVRIRDGEIQARGPEMFHGYLDEALNPEAFTDDGWFRTGDLGTVDDDGYLVVTGRAKDIVIRSGEKISAREIEALLAGHPKVAEAAIVALPDPDTGERACACIVPRSPDDPPTLAELADLLLELGVSRRKSPEQLEIVRELPATASGKVDKASLRSWFSDLDRR